MAAEQDHRFRFVDELERNSAVTDQSKCNAVADTADSNQLHVVRVDSDAAATLEGWAANRHLDFVSLPRRITGIRRGVRHFANRSLRQREVFRGKLRNRHEPTPQPSQSFIEASNIFVAIPALDRDRD